MHAIVFISFYHFPSPSLFCHFNQPNASPHFQIYYLNNNFHLIVCFFELIPFLQTFLSVFTAHTRFEFKEVFEIAKIKINKIGHTIGLRRKCSRLAFDVKSGLIYFLKFIVCMGCRFMILFQQSTQLKIRLLLYY